MGESTWVSSCARVCLCGFCAVVLLASCAARETDPDMLGAAGQTHRRTHERLHGTLWIQTAAEYYGASQQAYRVARGMLEHGLRDPHWVAAVEQGSPADLPPAVIMDIDETVLDNSRFEARLVIENADYDRKLWQEWVSLARAKAVPGALGFVKYAKSRGVEVFFVTNRHVDVERDTRANLADLGFPVRGDRDVILSKKERPEWGSDKASRRKFIAREYRITLLIGDDLGDFVSDAHKRVDDRRRSAEKYREYWGTKWILLPNPLYGSWERSLYDFDFGLEGKDILEKKYNYLEPF